MRLTKLELHGFKSFAKKTEIQFDKGITAIVGPNGSGKSNIADAIRWVLGEQSAKTLRGNRMEDVIFSGTATRKSMSYCEVTLIFDNSDGQLPVDYSEVSITRRVYRSGESEYYINKTNCRLRDLHELFRDTGLGKEGYSIVGQGKVEEILSNKSGERRKAFEEAAGIMKYRVRKEEAARNLENTRKNLTRLGDIMTEIEERIEPLSEQAEKASRYLKLRDELRELDINLFLYQYDKVKDRISNIDQTIEQLSGEINDTDAARTELALLCGEAEENERKVGAELSAQNAKLVDKTAGLEEQIGNLKVMDERIQGAEREHAALLIRIEENEKRLSDLKSRQVAQDDRNDERDNMLVVLNTEYKEASEKLALQSKSIEDKANAIETLKNAMFEAANKLGDAKSSISRFTATLENLQNRLSQMKDNESDIYAEEEKLSQEMKHAQDELAESEAKSAKAQGERAAMIEASNELTAKRRELDELVRKTEQMLENKKSRLNALMDMKRAHDGYYTSIQKLMADASRDESLRSMIEGTVAELIHVPKEYETALEMAMGATLQNIVTPNEAAAKYAVRHLRENRYGRATFLPITNMRPRLATAEERRAMQRVKGYIGVASELIGFDERYRDVVENLLGRTVIVDNLDSGTEINKATGQTVRIATLEGDIINPGGSITGGSIGKSLNLLGRERECAELLGEIDKLKKALAAGNAKKAELEVQSTRKADEISKLSTVCHELDISIATQRDKADIIAQQLDKIKQRHENAEQERLLILENMADIEESLSRAKEAQERLSGDNATTQTDIVKAQTELAQMRAEQGEQTDIVTDLKVRIAALEKEADALKDENERLCKDIDALEKTVEADRQCESGFGQEQERIEKERDALQLAVEESRTANAELYTAYKRLENERSELMNKVDALRKQKEEADEKLDELRERKHRQELSRSKSESEMGAMQDRMWSEYELTYENAQSYRKQIPITASTQRATELKHEIRELGDINVNAIEEYHTLNERYTAMCEQIGDLHKAEDDLNQLINELTNTMETNFREKFVQICANFKQVFTELFGGGTAELILSDENDILNCDIDILAQIPGKKLKSLAPLSGGERALTAIALQFAILRLKPTAFCLLDEIDASLDEVNVSRFADYLHAYAASTQFILITHRKGSMESCNAIYGVAQEEKGVSKLVSARLAAVSVE